MWSQDVLTVPPELTAQNLLRRLEDGTTTYFIRYGDSDLKMLEDLGHSSKTQTNCPKLRRELRECLKYYRDRRVMFAPGVGLDTAKYDAIKPEGAPSFRHYPTLDNIGRKFLPQYIEASDLFENCHALTIKFIYHPKWFVRYFELIRQRNPIFLGGKTLCGSRRVLRVLGCRDRMPFRDKQCYAQLDKKWPEIKAAAQNHDTIVCVLSSTGKAIALRLLEMGWEGYFVEPGSIAPALQAPAAELFARGDSRGWIKHLFSTTLRDFYNDYRPKTSN
jgi:hypothetical protein